MSAPRAARVLLAATALVPQAQLAEDESRPPAEMGIVEQVEVQLVLIDVLVLDRRERTVPALGRDDFELYVDGDPMEIVSVDADCAAGRMRDVRAGEARAEARRRSGEAAPRRIVHAFDYYHMASAAETLEQARAAIRRLSGAADQQMLVSIGPGLRVEQPFTGDPDELDRALVRMYGDRGLYAGQLGRLTDRRFYRKLESLMDFLELIDGPKVVVLYSGPFEPDGFDHDPEFRRIAALSARARVALYPVDSGGLRAPLSFSYGDLGGPKELARLAVETGGRVTYHTNDLGLALARAQRDLSCRYTLGFRDKSGKRDRARSVRVWLRRPGLRVIHPVFYVIRSPENLLEDRVRTARMVPEMFDSGGLWVDARALRPSGPGRWDVLVAIDLPEALRAVEGADPWQVDGTVLSPSGATQAHFRREIPPPPPGGDAPGSPPMLVEHVQLDPGVYDVGVVLHRPGLDAPLAVKAGIELPPIPRDEVFLVGPQVGRFSEGPAPPDAGREADDPAAGPTFEPLGPRGVPRGASFDALTWVCRVGRRNPAGEARIVRDVTAETGETVGSFDAAVVEFGRAESVDCHALVDAIATADLCPGRYAVRAYVEASGLPVERAFAVTP